MVAEMPGQPREIGGLLFGCGFFSVATCGLYAFASRHDYRQPAVVEFVLEHAFHLLMVLGERVDGFEVVGADAETEAYILEFSCAL